MRLTTVSVWTSLVCLINLCSAYTVPRNDQDLKHSINSNDFGTAADRSSEIESHADWVVERFSLPATWKSRFKVLNTKTLNIKLLEQRLDWLQQRLQLTENDLKRLVRGYPGILNYRSARNLDPTLHFLQDRLQLSNEQLSKLVLNNPRLISQGIGEDQSLERNIVWAQSRLDLNPKQLRSLLRSNAWLLSASVDNKLNPSMDSIGERLSLDEAELARVCRRGPGLLYPNFAKSIAPKLDWYQEHLNLTTSQLAAMIARYPNIAYCNIERNIVPTLRWLKARMGKEIALKAVFDFPQLLTLRSATIAAKIDFLYDHLDDALAERVIVEFPQILGYSLEKRLKLRVEEAIENGVVLDFGCLKRIGVYAQDRWAASVEFQVRQSTSKLNDW